MGGWVCGLVGWLGGWWVGGWVDGFFEVPLFQLLSCLKANHHKIRARENSH